VVNVEILVIGNEILLGLVQDTNSNYLCQVVRELGGRVRQITVVPDELDAIANGLTGRLERGAELVFTCGGLGPTDDDMTLAAVAQATGRATAVDPDARRLVERKYLELARAGHVKSGDMSESRRKMAQLPVGARMIPNPVGAAPAALLEVGGAHVISLPGVPTELKAIVEGPLQPVLAKLLGGGAYSKVELTVNCGDESVLAPILRQAATANPNVYIKSRAAGFGPEEKFRITFSSSAATVQETEEQIRAAVDDLSQLLAPEGITVAPETTAD